tara:strand:- start:597 stop:773 length:177 start_codon:yes stop_codon:yes gene_type:complete
MNEFYKILMIWGGVFLGVCLLWLYSPMDGRASRADGKVFAFLILTALGGTIAISKGKN